MEINLMLCTQSEGLDTAHSLSYTPSSQAYAFLRLEVAKRPDQHVAASLSHLVCARQSTSLLHKVLDPVQPAQVLLLLLDVNVLRDEERQGCVDATRIEVRLEQALDLLVELLEGRAGVERLGGVAEELAG